MSQAETKSSTSRRKALTAIAGIAGSAVVATSAVATAAAKPDSGLSDLDYHAALKRFQSMIASLRNCYVCEGWHGVGLDEAAAERVLKYEIL